jgi:peptidoglycan/LPS O-acetylase OafA/YrhL
MTETIKSQRVDIQALRGLAVLLVILYHTKLGNITGGYLGVDIFFVLSGYLITTLIATDIQRQNFKIQNFYFRRAKRLLPAAYTTFAVTAILAPWFLNQLELKDLAYQIIGAVTFTGNIVLWQQAGYFEGAADLKPLLHVWSLAIEEQYYFLLPFILLYMKPTRWLKLTVILAVLSLMLCVVGLNWKPVATFYLLPTRAWELLIGSIGALWSIKNMSIEGGLVKKIINILYVPSLLSIIFLPLFPLNSAHPGINALIVCVATIVVILKKDLILNQSYPAKLFAKVGDYSYSLYLVHWPIISFMKNAWVGPAQEVPLQFRLITLCLSFGVAYLLYNFVENPIRQNKFNLSKPLLGKVLLASVALSSIIPIAMYVMPVQTNFKEIRRANYGFSQKCEYKEGFTAEQECQSSTEPNLMVWGDSFAMHLVPGIAQQWTRGGVIQATKSQCGPFIELAPKHITKPEFDDFMDQNWSEKCIKFNESVIEFIKKSTSIKTVVLSSPFIQYVTQENYQFVTVNGAGFSNVPASIGLAEAALNRTIDELRSAGKKVVVVAPPPSSGMNIGGCLERKLSQTVAFGGTEDCSVALNAYNSKQKNVFNFLESVSKKANIEIIRFDDLLCSASKCVTYLEQTILYRDTGHLSYDGSVLLAKKINFEKVIFEKAH